MDNLILVVHGKEEALESQVFGLLHTQVDTTDSPSLTAQPNFGKERVAVILDGAAQGVGSGQLAFTHLWSSTIVSPAKRPGTSRR